MIVEWFIDQAVAFLTFLFDSFPAPDLGDFFSQVDEYLIWFSANTDWIDEVIPLPLIGALIGFKLLALTAGWSIKIIRIVASYLTLGGGMGA